ncbi:MAG: hypothetical protein KOO61_04750 [Spirochaetales bacterium]|nr:hypothetical protein [Spirochaetales bacterium]
MGAKMMEQSYARFAEALIRKKARMLEHHRALWLDDRHDIEQWLWEELLCRWEKYDGVRSSAYQFIAAIVNNAASRLIERNSASKRGSSAFCESLDEELPGHGEATGDRYSFLDGERYNWATRDQAMSKVDRHDLGIDLEAVLSALPPDLQIIAFYLSEFPPAEAARKIGIPRSTLNERRAKIRKWFKSRKLDEYLN